MNKYDLIKIPRLLEVLYGTSKLAVLGQKYDTKEAIDNIEDLKRKHGENISYYVTILDDNKQNVYADRVVSRDGFCLIQSTSVKDSGTTINNEKKTPIHEVKTKMYGYIVVDKGIYIISSPECVFSDYSEQETAKGLVEYSLISNEIPQFEFLEAFITNIFNKYKKNELTKIEELKEKIEKLCGDLYINLEPTKEYSQDLFKDFDTMDSFKGIVNITLKNPSPELLKELKGLWERYGQELPSALSPTNSENQEYKNIIFK